ncbi:MAG: FAD-dependent thymidylate synthase [Acidipropionibacterium jensenii]|uniref:FAD-dependent thymidylate synthase n=1 Tax=Corynebacterium variabile TaxID=1727 RepID=UPI002649EFE8|nr:FAD-dependent thymidylate synthase [Corynebacterium variabile]MDN6657427.1 FAD-dependent thymidylate synthase [Acidipropionibacterium jensenii]MDN6676772.1 FAD-dependent thymidylate synthase [Corynebacterium variabile]
MNIVEPRIEIIASTGLRGYRGSNFHGMELQNATPAESLCEFAGRGCYESFGRPNAATATTSDYLDRTVFDQGHGSILEHATVTLRFSGVSRSWLTEMERHRHLSWSVASQRYIDSTTFGAVMPPAIRDAGDATQALWATSVDSALRDYEILVDHLHDSNISRKQAREAARSVLPNSMETRGVVTGNLRAWLSIIPLRTADGADAEMQEVSRLILETLRPIAPTIFKE